MRVGIVFVQLLQNERPYIIAMVITYVGLRNDYNGQCDTVNNGYTVTNSIYYHLSYTDLLGYINCYYDDKTLTKLSLKGNAH
jgi:hypothetical protein